MSSVVKFLLFALLLMLQACTDTTPSQPATKNAAATPGLLFSQLDPARTGVDFVNNVEDGETFNILSYRNFYNGGGVAIGDVNNDGLADLYFTANMAKNRLYLNKGNLKFEDVTEKAGVGGTRAWSTGVTMADVNGDGFLDIYVCNSGDVAGDNKENELFINNGTTNGGIPAFTEKAAAYGLNDSGFSTHASFFDYDLDGDLDCYILNNSFKDPGRIELFRKARSERDPMGGDKLLRNNGAGLFEDVSAAAGIYGSAIGFGLGVSVSDLNGDLLPDIYISNDFWERDYLYFNRGDGTFSEELTARTGHCSVSSMGADISDLNNDGHPEIFSTDMLPADNYRIKTMAVFDEFHLEDAKYRADFHYQILQNCLQINDGQGNFSETAHFSGVAATDWSWGALAFDFDLDGWRDLYVCNGIYRDIMYQDFTTFINDKAEVKKTVTAKGRFDWRDFVPFLPQNKLPNYAFLNRAKPGVPRFDNVAAHIGLGEPSFSNGAAYGDLDNDGDLELVVNNVNMPAFIYKNEVREKLPAHYIALKFEGIVPNRFGVGACVDVFYRDQNGARIHQTQQNFPSRGFESAVEPKLLFGLDQTTRLDSLIVVWPDRQMQVLTDVTADQTLVLHQNEAKQRWKPTTRIKKPLFHEVTNNLLPGVKHQENRYNDFETERLLPRMLSTEGPCLAKGDANGDGREDLFLGGGPGQADRIFMQQAGGNLTLSKQPALEADVAYESSCAAFFDADRDGDADLLVGAGGNEPARGIKAYLLRYYENDGKGNFKLQKEKTPPAAGNISCIVPGDFDNDGDPDLFIGSRCVPGQYGMPSPSFLFRNNGGDWEDLTTKELGSSGMITAAVWTDLEGDRDLDLVLAGEWTPIVAFRNDGGRFTPALLPVVDAAGKAQATSGWWSALTAADLDGDGDEDLVAGNWGLNSRFKATPDRPLSLYVNDFDKNGKSEFILEWFTEGDKKPYPFAAKNDLTTQMPFLKKKALKYEDYARQTFETLFDDVQRKSALAYKCATLAHCIFWNEGKSRYRREDLPVETQLSPVFSILTADLDGDGRRDIWLGGNFFDLKPEAGRMDAGAVSFLRGTEPGHFQYVSPAQSGFSVKGQVRDATLLGKNIVLGVNNDNIRVFRR